jgi:hypothetical protein
MQTDRMREGRLTHSTRTLQTVEFEDAIFELPWMAIRQGCRPSLFDPTFNQHEISVRRHMARGKHASPDGKRFAWP